MKRVKFNEKIKIIYVDSYKEYNKENSYQSFGIKKSSNESKKIINFDNFFVKLFGFIMYKI